MTTIDWSVVRAVSVVNISRVSLSIVQSFPPGGGDWCDIHWEHRSPLSVGGGILLMLLLDSFFLLALSNWTALQCPCVSFDIMLSSLWRDSSFGIRASIRVVSSILLFLLRRLSKNSTLATDTIGNEKGVLLWWCAVVSIHDSFLLERTFPFSPRVVAFSKRLDVELGRKSHTNSVTVSHDVTRCHTTSHS